MAVQADGKIVAAGESSTASTSAFARARYNRDGTLDTSSRGDGEVSTAFTGGEAYAYGVAIQADGKIVAAGGLYSTGNPSDAQFAVARYLR